MASRVATSKGAAVVRPRTLTVEETALALFGERRMTPDEARMNGYYRLPELAMVANVDPHNARNLIQETLSTGKTERVKVGKEYYYRVKP